MGCDIHLRVEYLAPSETLKNPTLEVVPEGPPEWTFAEKLTHKDESGAGKWLLEKIAAVDTVGVGDYRDEYDGLPTWDVEYEDKFYTGRDYALFSALAGVRGRDHQIWEERGFPEDACDNVREDYEAWGEDGHTPSWQTLDELLQVDWKALFDRAHAGYVNKEWAEALERLKDLAYAKCDGNQTHVRIVYWFDN